MVDTAYVVVTLAAQERVGFRCGHDALDKYLQTQAGQDVKRRVATCFLAIDSATGKIAGYYTLSACHVRLDDVSSDWQKKLPRYPVVPGVRLGRLAIDVAHQGRKLGVALLANAAARVLRAEIAAHMMVVEAKDDTAAAFYRHHGFHPDPANPLRLYVPLVTLARALGLA